MNSNYRVLITIDASDDLSEVVEGLEQYRAYSGMNLVLRYDEILKLLESTPLMYREVKPKVRKASMKPFKFSIYYRVDELDKTVKIIAILSDLMSPDQIKRILN